MHGRERGAKSRERALAPLAPCKTGMHPLTPRPPGDGGGAQRAQASTMERRTARPGGPKNLRAISLALVAKVRRLRVTTSTALANELAQEAVAEAGEDSSRAPGARAALEKNARRRLYDSLKVLVSVGAIARSRRDKTLRWNGTAHLRRAARAGGGSLARFVASARTRVRAKAVALRAHAAQVAGVRALCARNRARVAAGASKEQRVFPPFVLVRAPAAAKIEMDAEEEGANRTFTLNARFEVVNDSGVLHMLFPAPPPPVAVAATSRHRAYAPAPAPLRGFGGEFPSLPHPSMNESPDGSGGLETASMRSTANVHLDLRAEIDMDLDIADVHGAEKDLWELSTSL